MSEQHDYEGVTDAEFYQRAPKKRIAAGLLARDEAGRVLLVKPTYKKPWEIPGGVVDVGESPLATCGREIREELGVAWPIGRLLVVDYVGDDPPFMEGLMLVFDGGVHKDKAARVNPSAASELSAAEWCSVEVALGRVDNRLARRLRSALETMDSSGSTRYLEEGVEVIYRG